MNEAAATTNARANVRGNFIVLCGSAAEIQRSVNGGAIFTVAPPNPTGLNISNPFS